MYQTDSPTPSQPTPELKTKKSSGLLRRITNRLKPPSPHTNPSHGPLDPSPPSRVSPGGGRFLMAGPSPPNEFVSKQAREAALRERGLLVPSLSQLEKELDQRNTKILPPPESVHEGESAAKKIQQEWKAKNKSNAIGDGGSRPLRPTYPETLGKPDFSRPKLKLETQYEEQPENENVEELNQSFLSASSSGPSVYRTPQMISTEDFHSSPPRKHKHTKPTEKELPDLPPPQSRPNRDKVSSPPSQKTNYRRAMVISTTSSRDTLFEAQALGTIDEDRNVLTIQSSVTAKSSLPALSPSKSISSVSSIATPQDGSGEHANHLSRPLSERSSFTNQSSLRSSTRNISKFHDQTDMDVPDELGAFEAYVERRQKMERRKSTGIFHSSHSSASRFSGDFTSSYNKNGEFTVTTSVSSPGSLGGPQPQKKFASLRRTMSKIGPNTRIAFQSSKPPPLPTDAATGPVRKPTVAAAFPSRAKMINEIREIDDDESRRLAELAFLDY